MTSAKVLESLYYRTTAAALEKPSTRKSPPQDVVAYMSAGQSRSHRQEREAGSFFALNDCHFRDNAPI